MSVASIANSCCAQISLSEPEALGNVAPSLESRDAGAVRALYSPQNGGVLTTIEDGKERPSNSSQRKVKVRYTVKSCEESDETPVDRCNITSTVTGNPFRNDDVIVSGFSRWGFTLNDSELRMMCENRKEFYDAVLKTKLDSAVQGFNKKVLNQLITKMGKYPLSGDESLINPITIPVVTTQGVANPAGLALVKSIYQQMNRQEEPIIVGAGKLDFLANALQYSGLSGTGINGAAASNQLKNFFRDANVNSAGIFEGTGTDNILSWVPGAIRLIEYYDNAGDFLELGPISNIGGQEYREYEYGRVELGGILWDYYMKHDCGVWKFAFQKWFEVFAVPDEAFANCQPYNYALAFALGCGDLNCDLINAATVAPLQTT